MLFCCCRCCSEKEDEENKEREREYKEIKWQHTIKKRKGDFFLFSPHFKQQQQNTHTLTKIIIISQELEKYFFPIHFLFLFQTKLENNLYT